MRRFKEFIITISLVLNVRLLCNEQPISTPKLLTIEEAIAITLKNQREIQISQMNVAEQRGILQSDAGPFDPVLNADITYIANDDKQDFVTGLRSDMGAHETIADLNFTKETRFGTKFSFIATVHQFIDPFEFFLNNLPDPKSNQGFMTFEIDQPLLRGFIDGVNVTIERADRMQLVAATLDNLHVVSTKLTETVQQYWEVVAAQNLLKIREETEKRFLILKEKTQKLINDEEIAKSDILQPEAQLGRSRVEKILSQQNLYASMQRLLLNLGISEEGYEVSGEHFVPSEFPPIPEGLVFDIEVAEKFINYALYARNDIRASKMREVAADILVKGGYNQLLPQLDVFTSVTKQNFTIKKDFNPIYRPLGYKHPQTDYAIGLRFSIPIGNNQAKGNLYQQKAIKQRINLVTQQLGQGAYSDIFDAWSNHVALSNAIKENDYVIEKNTKLVEDEQKKLADGFSTLFVLIDFENRLTESLVIRVDLIKQFMQNIATLRFLTATVINPNLCLSCYYVDNMTSLPEIKPNPSRQP